MHVIHHTRGIVVESIDSGESDRYVYFLTDELGLIGALARGARHMRSRLRYSIQQYAFVQADFVRGKHGWRLASIIPQDHFLAPLEESGASARRFPVIRISRLLRKIASGEEKNTALFQDVRAAFTLFRRGILSETEIRELEGLLVMRTLRHLGYWGGTVPQSLFEGDLAPRIGDFKIIRSVAIPEINRALKAAL